MFPSRQRKGIAIVTAAFSMLLLVPVLGLAIDVSFCYALRARLAAAADAAALAALRSADQPGLEQRAAAFFEANFPAGYLNTRQLDVRVDVLPASDGATALRVTGSVTAPTFFLKAVGYDGTTIRAAGTAARKGENLYLTG